MKKENRTFYASKTKKISICMSGGEKVTGGGGGESGGGGGGGGPDEAQGVVERQ